MFDTAVEAIHLLISQGFRVTTNTTFFHGQTPQNAIKLLDFLASLGVDGMTVAPAFSYEDVSEKEDFLRRDTAIALFQQIFNNSNGRQWYFNHSTLYLDFLSGNQNYACMPWGCPTRNIFGWQRPCYLISDEYVATYKELIEDTCWDKYGVGHDVRCADCMVHCGFEPTAVKDSVKHPFKTFLIYTRRTKN